MRSPCDRIPAMLVTRDPCHKSLRLGSFENGLKRCDSPLRTTLNTYRSKLIIYNQINSIKKNEFY